MSQESVSDMLARADLHYERGDFRQALALYERVLLIDPEHAYAHSRVGAICAQTGDLARAEQAIGRALELDPQLAAAHSNLGNILYSRGDWEGALGKYKQAVALAPENPLFYDNLHAAYKKLGQLDQAVAAYKKARSLDRLAVRSEAKHRWRHATRRMGCGSLAGLCLLLILVGTIVSWSG